MGPIEKIYSIFCENPIITIDSRKVPANSIFFAIQGTNFNGNDFATDALNKGASYAIVDESVKGVDKRFIKVDNTLQILQKLATYHRKKLGTKILAITGTNGKTTTKELCKSILSRKYNVLATLGNLNNHIGVPLTLLQLSKTTEIGIIEMGANHPGEISELCRIAQPDLGLITNIGKAHLEGFGDIDGVVKAKGELYAYLQQNNKTIFVNRGNNYTNSLLPENDKNGIAYNDTNYRAELISSNPFLSVDVKLSDKSFIINSKLIGKYNIENIIASAVVGNYFRVPVNQIKEAIEAYIPDNLRSQYIVTERNKIIMDAYNANPSSMQTAIDNFLELEGENKLMILGQMLELGDATEKEHRKIINYLEEKNFMNVVFIGKLFSTIKKDSPGRFYHSVDDLISKPEFTKIHSSMILIKGSRGNKLEELLTYL